MRCSLIGHEGSRARVSCGASLLLPMQSSLSEQVPDTEALRHHADRENRLRLQGRRGLLFQSLIGSLFDEQRIARNRVLEDIRTSRPAICAVV